MFFKLAWQDALRSRDLLKPLIYSLVCGLFLTLLGLVPLGLVSLQPGGWLPWAVLTGFWLVVLLAAQFAIASFFSGMTAVLFYSYQAGAGGGMAAAWQVVRRRWFDLLSFSAAYVGLGLWRKPDIRLPVSSSQPETLNLAWAQAAYLVTPVIAIEDLGLKAGLRRTSQMVGDRLPQVGTGLIGVRMYNLALSGLLALVGAGLWLASAAGLSPSHVRALPGFNLPLYAGAALFGLCLLLAVVFSAFTSTAYHTALYVWAANVEHARQSGSFAPLPPSCLSAVLSRPRSSQVT